MYVSQAEFDLLHSLLVQVGIIAVGLGLLGKI